jgi:uncharacterized protein (UPF0333 family)
MSMRKKVSLITLLAAVLFAAFLFGSTFANSNSAAFAAAAAAAAAASDASEKCKDAAAKISDKAEAQKSLMMYAA